MNVSNLTALTTTFRSITQANSISPDTVASLFDSLIQTIANAQSAEEVSAMLVNYVTKTGLQATVADIKNLISAVGVTASSAQSAGNDAKDVANAALAKAANAESTASSAYSRAGTAINYANSAISKASDAESTANSAKNTATSAESTASEARSLATQALTMATQTASGSGSSSSTASSSGVQHIYAEIEDGKLYIRGNVSKLLESSLPVVFRKCTKRNTWESITTETFYGKRRKGWCRFGNQWTVKVDASTGLVSIVTETHDRLSVISSSTGRAYSAEPDYFMSVKIHDNGKRTTWGKRIVKLDGFRSFAFAIGFTNKTEHSNSAVFDFSSLTSSLAKFHVSWVIRDPSDDGWHWEFTR